MVEHQRQRTARAGLLVLAAPQAGTLVSALAKGAATFRTLWRAAAAPSSTRSRILGAWKQARLVARRKWLGYRATAARVRMRQLATESWTLERYGSPRKSTGLMWCWRPQSHRPREFVQFGRGPPHSRQSSYLRRRRLHRERRILLGLTGTAPSTPGCRDALRRGAVSSPTRRSPRR